jgi:hypothetical protein
VEDVGLNGIHTALKEDEESSLICIKSISESVTALVYAAQRIRRNVRQGDTVLLAERVCVIILPRTAPEGAQAVARRLALLLVDVEYEMELLYGPSAQALIERLQAIWAVEIREDTRAMTSITPTPGQALPPGHVEIREDTRAMASIAPTLGQAVIADSSMPYLAFLEDYPPRRLFRLFPYDLACQYQCIPVGADRGMLTVGTCQRLAENVIAHFRQVTKHGIFQVRCEAKLIDDVLRYWQRLYEVETMFN